VLRIVILCNGRDLMDPYVNNRARNLIADAAILLMTAAVIALFTIGS
jgi:hypothetical protein